MLVNVFIAGFIALPFAMDVLVCAMHVCSVRVFVCVVCFCTEVCVLCVCLSVCVGCMCVEN